jgi:hypothetical protein
MNKETNTDDVIDTLKAKITKLKEENKREVFKPITSCKFTLLNQEYNILTLSLIDLYAIRSTLVDIPVELQLAGYNIVNWINDIDNKIKDITYTEKAKQIKSLETTLDNLVSEERKKANQLSDIAATLANM